MFTEKTRFKLAVGCLALYFIEGIVKALMPGFPIEIVVGAEGFIAGYYFTIKTVDNIKTAKYNSAGVESGA